MLEIIWAIVHWWSAVCRIGHAFVALAPKSLFPDKIWWKQCAALRRRPEIHRINRGYDCRREGCRCALYRCLGLHGWRKSNGQNASPAGKIIRSTKRWLRRPKNPDVIFAFICFSRSKMTVSASVFRRIRSEQMEMEVEWCIFRALIPRYSDEAENQMHAIKAVMCARWLIIVWMLMANR